MTTSAYVCPPPQSYPWQREPTVPEDPTPSLPPDWERFLNPRGAPPEAPIALRLLDAPALADAIRKQLEANTAAMERIAATLEALAASLTTKPKRKGARK
jgi:hypothetical protein